MKRRLFLALLAAPRLYGKPPTWTNMKTGVFYMEDNYGSWEEFKIGGASYNLHTQEDGTRELTVEISCCESLKRTPELVEVFGKSMPGFEATAVLSPERPAMKAGDKIIQRESYDRNRNENLSWFTYGGTGSLENLRIEVLKIENDLMDVKLSGSYDGSNSKVAMRIKLKKDPGLKRSVE